MSRENIIFLNDDVYALWHDKFGMIWFRGGVIVKFPEITLEQSKAIIGLLRMGVDRDDLSACFESLRIERSTEIVNSLVEEGLIEKKTVGVVVLPKVGQTPLCDFFSMEEGYFSGVVTAYLWCWFFPIPVDISTAKDIVRKELGQLCLSVDSQLFRIMSCEGGFHLFPDYEKRIDNDKFFDIDPVRINLENGERRRIKKSAQDLFSGYIGPGKVISSILKSKLDLPFLMYSARYSDPDEYDPKPHLDCCGCGRDADGNMAKLKAVAEAVERLAASQIPYDAVCGTYKEVDGAIHPDDLIQVLPERLEKINWLKRFDESSRYLWVDGYEYFTGDKIKILADLVYYPYYPVYKAVTTANSTGVATHQSIDLAIESAILELMERDAFIIHWLLEKTPDRISNDSLPIEFKKSLDWLEENVSSFCLFNLGTDSIPVFGSMAIKENVGLWVSAAADCDPRKAMHKVLQEIVASAATRNGSNSDYVVPDRINRVVDHEMLYKSKEAQKHAMFLTKGENLSWDKIIRQYEKKESPVEFMGGISSPLYIIKLQCYNRARQVDERLFTVRVLSPYFVPLNFAEDLIPDASSRLRTFQEKWKCKGLNLYPHPFT